MANTRDGLVGWWKLNDGTGVSAADSAGANTGTLTGANGLPVWTSNCPRSGCLTFDGVDDFVDTPHLSELVNVSQFTLASWVRRKASNSFVVLGQTDTTWTEYTAIQLWNDGQIYVVATDNGYGSIASNDTAWHHVVLIYDGTLTGNSNRLKMYFDGVLQTLNYYGLTVPATSGDSSGHFEIGRNDGSSFYYTTGSIDDVRVYNRAITAQEALDLYNAGIKIGNAHIGNAKFNL